MGLVLPFPRGRSIGAPFVAPLDRDPQHFPFGLLLAESRLFNGLDGFSWFASEAAAAHYLRAGVWRDLGFEEAQDCPAREIYRSALSSTSRLNESALIWLAGRQEILDVLWFGFFDQLLAGAGPFAAVCVADFREWCAGRRAVNAVAEREDFVRYLQRYRSTRVSKGGDQDGQMDRDMI